MVSGGATFFFQVFRKLKREKGKQQQQQKTMKQTPRPISDKVEGDAERKKGPRVLRPIASLSGSGELFRSTVFLRPALISLIHPSSPLAL